MEEKLLITLLILSHILGDFIFQSDRMVNNKKENLKQLLLHSFVILVLSLIFTGYYLSRGLLIIVLAVGIVHFIIDFAKIKVERFIEVKYNRFLSRFKIFLIDQVLHILSIVLIVDYALKDWTIKPFSTGVQILDYMGNLFPIFNRVSLIETDWYVLILLLCGYLFIWTPASFIVDLTLVNFKSSETEKKKKVEEQTGRLKDPGVLIGKLERLVLLTLFLSQNFAAIPVVFAAKSIARFKNFRNEEFVNYYIVGTFVSLLISITIGVFLNYIIYLENYNLILYELF